MADVLVAGHICLDVIPSLDRPPRFEPGNLYEVGEATFAPGGGVPNVGLSLGRLGVDATLVGQIGDDAFGSILRSSIEERNPTGGRSLLVTDRAATSYTVVLSHPGADRIFLHHPGCNAAFEPSSVELRDVDARILYFGYPPLMEATFRDGGGALAELFRRARERGMTTVLDMAMPDADGPSGGVDWEAFLATVLPTVDLVVPSAYEIGFMLTGRPPARVDPGTPPTTPERNLLARLLELGAGAAVLTLGGRGMALATGPAPLSNLPASEAWRSRELWAPGFDADVVGTTGAGDATAAALIAGLLRDLEPERTITMAAAVGACAVEAADATSGVRGWGETQARVERGWDRTAAMESIGGWELVGDVFAGPTDPAFGG